jgi:hypothetical protein
MDDNKLKAEFPIGTSTVVVTEPSPGQMFVLALSRKPQSDDAASVEKVVRRLLRVLEALTGEQQWYEVIEEGMISGEITPEQLTRLAVEVVQFDWAGPRPAAAETVLHDPSIDPVTRPAPRIVSGG